MNFKPRFESNAFIILRGGLGSGYIANSLHGFPVVLLRVEMLTGRLFFGHFGLGMDWFIAF